MTAHDYRVIAAEIEQDIRGGRLAVGTRLTPQRIFAYQRGIATSTAGRVYGELRRKELIVGEVGRGSYVRPLAPVAASPAQTSDAIDLTVSRPELASQERVVARSLSDLSTFASLARSMHPPGTAELRRAGSVASRFLSRTDWLPSPDGVAFGGNAREMVFAALSVLLRRGDRLGVESLSFSATKGIADRLGVTLEPLRMDGEGASPDELERVHAELGVKVFLLQPNLHNPLGCTMRDDRKRRIADLIRRHGLVVVEDAANAFLSDEPPLASYAPDGVVLVDSLSKRISPGLTIGMAVSPERLRVAVARAARSTAWTSMGWMFHATVKMMEDGTAAELALGRRSDAAARQALARTVFDPQEILGDGRSYHLWLPLRAPWRSEAFEDAAAQRGVLISPSHLYAVRPGHAPAAVRLSLGTPSMPNLLRALQAVRELAASGAANDSRRIQMAHS